MHENEINELRGLWDDLNERILEKKNAEKSMGHVPNFVSPTVGWGKSHVERKQQAMSQGLKGRPKEVYSEGRSLRIGTLQGAEAVRVFLKELKTGKYNKIDTGNITGSGTIQGLMNDKMLQRLRENGIKFDLK